MHTCSRSARLLLACAALLLGACAAFQRREPQLLELALPRTTVGPLFDRVADLQMTPEQSSYRLLRSNSAELLMRMRTTDATVSSLDLMYFAWSDDDSGQLLTSELLRAADRGVRVRLLVDDAFVRHLDASMAIIDSHPNLEIRNFNPLRSRDSVPGNIAEMVFTGMRPNRRMHNKAWIADGQVALVGGRNVGDAYFDLGEEFNFRDLGVLVMGAAVPAASLAFDGYWNSPMAIPIARIHPQPLTGSLAEAQAELERKRQAVLSASPMREWIADGRVGEKRLVGVGDPIGAAVEIITDPPDKGRMPARPLVGVAAAVRRMGDQAEHEFVLVSPYFVPGKDGARWLMDMAARGVAVSVLTNSLDATDVPIVHGGYSRYRKRLLRAGISIHELKPTSAASRIRRLLGGYSRSSLHTKAVVVDGRHALIGSYNFDPRSTSINTEMAVLIDDPVFAASVLADFQQAMDPLRSYRLSLRRNRLIWTDIDAGHQRVQDREPSASASRRLQAALASLLPIESQL